MLVDPQNYPHWRTFINICLALLRIEAEIPFLAQIFAAESEAVAAERVAGGAGRSVRLFAKIKELFERMF